MLTIRAMSNGKEYSSRHLEHSDYYAEGERVIGRWCGQGAELLGIGGQVEPDDFEALRQGLDPKTGESLRQRRSADRIGADGTRQSQGRHLYDFTFSAPKSASVLAGLGGDARLIEAHQRAVAEALHELELNAAARIRKKGANQDRTTGNLVVAVYHHDTSRELDPQLHTHAVASNLTYDRVERCWKALQASGIYERRSFLTEVYRNALAREVRQLGYDIENRRDGKGRDCGFEIRGVPDEILKRERLRWLNQGHPRSTTCTSGSPPSGSGLRQSPKPQRCFITIQTNLSTCRINPSSESPGNKGHPCLGLSKRKRFCKSLSAADSLDLHFTQPDVRSELSIQIGILLGQTGDAHSGSQNQQPNQSDRPRGSIA